MRECVNALLLEQSFDILYVVKRIVEVEFKVGNDAQLFAFAEAETPPKVRGVLSNQCQNALRCTFADDHNGDMDAGDGEVRSDTNTCDRDERRTEDRLHLAEEDVAHVLLYQSANLILTGTLHVFFVITL